MKLWYRELEEPLIPMNFYKQCVSNCDDPVAAITVVQSLPELNRLVLCYFIHFLQVKISALKIEVKKCSQVCFILNILVLNLKADTEASIRHICFTKTIGVVVRLDEQNS